MRTQVPRATAYLALTDLVALGLLVKSGVGRGTRYALQMFKNNSFLCFQIKRCSLFYR